MPASNSDPRCLPWPPAAFRTPGSWQILINPGPWPSQIPATSCSPSQHQVPGSLLQIQSQHISATASSHSSRHDHRLPISPTQGLKFLARISAAPTTAAQIPGSLQQQDISCGPRFQTDSLRYRLLTHLRAKPAPKTLQSGFYRPRLPD